MKKGTHGIDEKSFEELTYSNQAKSLNAQIQVLDKALKAHFRKGELENKDITDAKSKYKVQLKKVIDSLN
ncbi:hypothetical protein MASR2M69_00350 [Bacteroidota bacterium]